MNTLWFCARHMKVLMQSKPVIREMVLIALLLIYNNFSWTSQVSNVMVMKDVHFNTDPHVFEGMWF